MLAPDEVVALLDLVSTVAVVVLVVVHIVVELTVFVVSTGVAAVADDVLFGIVVVFRSL